MRQEFGGAIDLAPLPSDGGFVMPVVTLEPDEPDEADAIMERLWAGLRAFEPAADAMADWLDAHPTVVAEIADVDAGLWADTLRAASLVAHLAYLELAVELDGCWPSRRLDALPRPALPPRHARRGAENRMAEVIAFCDLCLKPAHKMVEQCLGSAVIVDNARARLCDRLAYGMKAIVGLCRGDLHVEQMEEAAARVAEANR